MIADLTPARWLSSFIALLLLSFPAIATEEPAKSEVAHLVADSIARYHRGEDIEEGWADLYDQGIDLAEKAIALDPENPDAHYALFLNLGRKSQRSGRVAQAQNIGRLKELLKKTLDLNPRHAHAWEATGEMLMQLPWLMGGSEKRGEEALRRSAELAPEWAKPPLRLGQYYWKNGEGERARIEAQHARDLAAASGEKKYLEEAEKLLSDIAASR